MITFITPTGDRPLALKLCAEFVTSQITDEKIQWIIVDDSVNGDHDVYRHQMSIIQACEKRDISLLHIGRQAKPEELLPGKGAMSLAQNLLQAIPRVEGDRILIFEDDDWYSPARTAIHLKWLENHDIVGPIWQPYYNLEQITARVFRNRGSSLCSTSFRASLLPLLEQVCKSCYERNFKGIDYEFWKFAKEQGYSCYISENKTHHCIGIKRLPGRMGIGIGHQGKRFVPDKNFKLLREWVGDVWAARYLEIRDALFGDRSGPPPYRVKSGTAIRRLNQRGGS